MRRAPDVVRHHQQRVAMPIHYYAATHPVYVQPALAISASRNDAMWSRLRSSSPENRSTKATYMPHIHAIQHPAPLLRLCDARTGIAIPQTPRRRMQTPRAKSREPHLANARRLSPLYQDTQDNKTGIDNAAGRNPPSHTRQTCRHADATEPRPPKRNPPKRAALSPPAASV